MANITNGTVTVQVTGGVGPYQYTLLNAGSNTPVPSNAYPTFTNPKNSITADTFTFGNANDITGNSGLQAGSYIVKIVDSNLCETLSSVLVVSNATPAPTATPVPMPTATPVPDPTATDVPDPTATPVPTAIPTATPVPTAIPTATPVPLALQPQRHVVSGWNLMAGEPEEFINGLLNKTEEEHREFFCNSQNITGVAHQAGNATRPYVLWTNQDDILTIPEIGGVFYANQEGTQYFENSGFLWWNSNNKEEETNYYWVTIGSNGIVTQIEQWTECIPDPTATPVPTAEPTATPVPTAEPTATPVPDPTATDVPVPTATPVPDPTATDVPDPTATPEPEPASGYAFHLGNGGYPYAQDLINEGPLYKSDNSIANDFADLFTDMQSNPGSYESVVTIPSLMNGIQIEYAQSSAQNYYWLLLPESMGIPDLTQEAKLADTQNMTPDVAGDKLITVIDGVPAILYRINLQPSTEPVTIQYIDQ